jgi:phage tail sheath protein FI
MPSSYTYPGVYVEEIPSGVRTIIGVSTSDTAFVDFFGEGPMDVATEVTSLDEFQRVFGGLHADSEASYGIQQFFLNGGQVAWVVRVASGTPAPARLTLQGGSPLQPALAVSAANPGIWGNALQVGIDWKTRDAGPTSGEFNLVVRRVEVRQGRRQVVTSQVFRNVTLNPGDLRFVDAVVNTDSSSLVKVTAAGLGDRPARTGDDVTAPRVLSNPATIAEFLPLGDPALPASDGLPPDATALIDGMKKLAKIAPRIFNILCLPRAASLSDGAMRQVVSQAEAFCEERRAFFILDIPSAVKTDDDMTAWMGAHDDLRHRNAAIYFPRLEIPDSLAEFRPLNVAVSGTLAGVYARTDATRGVWKAPAGSESDVRGATLTFRMTDPENGGLNPFGINALRAFPIFGNVSWGARTLDGADIQASEWKYIPVRRTALFIEESLYNGLKWVVFEPNDEPLWAQIRLNVGAFMHNLFTQGAFQGTKPSDAYLVRCDKTTTTQNDIDAGIVNILVGFAPLKPAEFVVIRIQQLAGQIQT